MRVTQVLQLPWKLHSGCNLYLLIWIHWIDVWNGCGNIEWVAAGDLMDNPTIADGNCLSVVLINVSSSVYVFTVGNPGCLREWKEFYIKVWAILDIYVHNYYHERHHTYCVRDSERTAPRVLSSWWWFLFAQQFIMAKMIAGTRQHRKHMTIAMNKKIAASSNVIWSLQALSE